MKSKKIGLYFILAVILVPAAAFASPERKLIQSPERQQKKASARNLAANVDLSKVEDPEARAAFQAIFDALEMKTKKPAVVVR